MGLLMCFLNLSLEGRSTPVHFHEKPNATIYTHYLYKWTGVLCRTPVHLCPTFR